MKKLFLRKIKMCKMIKTKNKQLEYLFLIIRIIPEIKNRIFIKNLMYKLIKIKK